MTGALVIIVDEATLGERTWRCGVVRNRELADTKTLAMDVEVDGTLEFGGGYCLVECVATYFEAYRWVLAALQKSDLEAFCGNRVLRTLLELPTEPPPPIYLEADSVYDFGDGRRDVLGDDWSVPSLDTSQLAAVRRALSCSLAVIQGPPGTGKTHVGLEVMRLLLRNPRSKAPILVVCVTNHALDAFLEGVLDFEPDIVRIGGRSSSERLADRNLRDLAKQWREADEARRRRGIF